MDEQITSVEDYLKRIKSYKKFRSDGNTTGESWLFRGQAMDSALKPKILRLTSKIDLLDAERQMFAEFKRANPLLVDPYRAIDEWDYLTLGQYFGLPTRLLDWSDNALTALWFATSLEIQHENQRNSAAVIWMLTTTEADFINIDTYGKPFDADQTFFYRPRIIKQRINNQSGVFSVHGNDALRRGISLLDMERYASRLVKLTIPHDHIDQIRSELNILGVHAFSIFPELEGLCDYLQWKFFDA